MFYSTRATKLTFIDHKFDKDFRFQSSCFIATRQQGVIPLQKPLWKLKNFLLRNRYIHTFFKSFVSTGFPRPFLQEVFCLWIEKRCNTTAFQFCCFLLGKHFANLVFQHYKSSVFSHYKCQYMPVCQSVSLSVCQSASLPVRQSASPPFCQSASLSVVYFVLVKPFCEFGLLAIYT